MSDNKRKTKACEGADKVRYQIEDINFRRCIGNYHSESAVHFIELYYNYQKGLLPFPGTIMEQPAKIIDIFQLIDGCIKTKQNEVEKERALEEKRKARTNGRR